MDAKEIMSKKFEVVLRGYRTDDVEEFLKSVSFDYSQIKKTNEELSSKLEVLADKIREYREDEDTLKDALLGAQRQGNALIANAKREAALIIEDARKKADDIGKKAEEDRLASKEKGEKEKAEARANAKNIIDEANEKARDIEDEMNLKTDVQKEILRRITSEIDEFKRRILGSYKKHIDEVERINETCENEFIRETVADFKASESPYLNGAKKSQAEASKSAKSSEAVKPAEAVKKAEVTPNASVPSASASPASNTAVSEDTGAQINENTIKFEIDVNEKFPNDETVEMNFDEIFGKNKEEKSGGAVAVELEQTEEIPLFKEGKKRPDNNKTNEMFFKKPKSSSGRPKALKFGEESDN